MYNLIEYSDNYSDSTTSLYHYKRQKPLENNASLDNTSSSFKYKLALLGGPNNLNNDLTAVLNNQAVRKNAQIIAPLKYISPCFRNAFNQHEIAYSIKLH